MKNGILQLASLSLSLALSLNALPAYAHSASVTSQVTGEQCTVSISEDSGGYGVTVDYGRKKVEKLLQGKGYTVVPSGGEFAIKITAGEPCMLIEGNPTLFYTLGNDLLVGKAGVTIQGKVFDGSWIEQGEVLYTRTWYTPHRIGKLIRAYVPQCTKRYSEQ